MSVTLDKKPVLDPTTKAIIEALRENTGRSLFDSGDYYGRGYERWAKVGDGDVSARPTARVDPYGYFVIDTVAWLARRVEYLPDADAAWERWAKIDSDDRPWLEAAERYVAWARHGDPGLDRWSSDSSNEFLYGEGFTGSVNTYNHESMLDETLQWVGFTIEDAYMTERCGLPEGQYVLLQTHNGCDVRGGYSRPRLFEATSSEGLFDLVDESVEVWCDGTSLQVKPQDETFEGMELPALADHHGWMYRNGEWVTPEGSFATDPWENNGNIPVINVGTSERPSWTVPCPSCGAPAEVSASEY